MISAAFLPPISAIALAAVIGYTFIALRRAFSRY